jgi:hypothetical protein
MERLAYLIKYRAPGLFRVIERAGRTVTVLRFGRRRERALANARIRGTVGGRPAEIRPMEEGEVARLTDFLAAMPEEHLRFFHPHGFDAREVERVLRSRAFMAYGLFVEGEFVAYGLLKLSPGGSAFRGRLVAPSFIGLGLGRFLSRYLEWQSLLSGLRPRATISRRNLASLNSLDVSGEVKVVSELPNDYLLIEFVGGTVSPPRLEC